MEGTSFWALPSRSVKHHCFFMFCQDVALERRKKGMETGLKEADDRLTDQRVLMSKVLGRDAVSYCNIHVIFVYFSGHTPRVRGS